MKNISQVIFVIIGTIIGAGFASGKEIYNFFIIYGVYGIIGAIIASIVVGYLIIKVFRIVEQKQLEDYDEFLTQITKRYLVFQKYPYILDSIKNIIKLFLLISFYIMVAAFAAYFSQEFGISVTVGATIFAIICYFVFMGSIERITKINTVLIPILIIIIICLALLNLKSFGNINKMQISNNYISSIKDAILYGSYNSIVLIPIIIPLKKFLSKKGDRKLIGFITIIILSILAIAIFAIVLSININVNNIELPTVYVATNFGSVFKYSYGIVIISAIFTSAISAGYGILENSLHNKNRYKLVAITICASSILVSKIGFSCLVNTMYPIFGVLGLAQILLILIYKKYCK